MPGRLVRDWMTSKLISVSSSSLLRDAYWLMIDNKVRRLPVIDDARLVGIMTLEDLRRAEPPAGIGLDLVKITDKLSKMTVRQVMSKSPITIAPDATLIEAARLMLAHKINALPVLEESQLRGIITENDILRAFVEFEEKT